MASRPLFQPNARSYITKQIEIISIEKPKTLLMRQLFEKEFNTLKFSDLTQIDTPHKGDVTLNGGPTLFFNSTKNDRIYSYNDKHSWDTTDYTIADFMKQQSTRFDVTDQVRKVQQVINGIPDVSKMWATFQQFIDYSYGFVLVSGICLGVFASFGAMWMAPTGYAVCALTSSLAKVIAGAFGYTGLALLLTSQNVLLWLVALMIAIYGVAVHRDNRSSDNRSSDKPRFG
jgi:hypothetical protein